MAPDPRVLRAFRAMKDLGISQKKVGPVLKQLLKVYWKNWDYIEQENYRLLVDAIFDQEEQQQKKGRNTNVAEPPKEPPLSNVEEEKLRLAIVPAAIKRIGPNLVSHPLHNEGKGKEALLFQSAPTDRKTTTERSTHAEKLKEQQVEHGNSSLPKNQVHNSQALVMLKDDDRFKDGDAQLAVPITMVHSEPPNRNPSSEYTPYMSREKGRTDCNFSNVADQYSSGIEIASSHHRVVKLCLTCSPDHERPDFYRPSIDAVMKAVEEKYLQSFGVTEQSFPVMKIMKDICDCFEQLIDSFAKESQERTAVGKERSVGPSKSPRPHLHVKDIAKGQENIKISMVNEVNEEVLPSFHYISQNVSFQDAYVAISLAGIGKKCCLTCLGNCLASPEACVCAKETGGDFAYTSEGLVKENFLEECISTSRSPQRCHHFYCRACPLERVKNYCIELEPCKGHVVRKFIKECWQKCHCKQQCGNRVVQRGITSKLQVFMTANGKGWGLRTLQNLPRGAFVCEFNGEILTNAEFCERTSQSCSSEEHAYHVLLDAGWGSRLVNDEEALWLDATKYGNVARFINHRCFDPNLVPIPVEVETPDRYYYHFAFFTTRKVEALEELTWDYGIDFDDHDELVKSFKCLCGSQFCRDTKC